jgi:hypothetical protein
VPGAAVYWTVDSSYRSGLAPFISLVYDPKAVMTFTIKGLPGGLVNVNDLRREQARPASSAVEGGRVLPEPGHEEEWLRQAKTAQS